MLLASRPQNSYRPRATEARGPPWGNTAARKTPSPPFLEDLSHLGSGERNLPTAKARYGPSERARVSHWVGERRLFARPRFRSCRRQAHPNQLTHESKHPPMKSLHPEAPAERHVYSTASLHTSKLQRSGMGSAFGRCSHLDTKPHRHTLFFHGR